MPLLASSVLLAARDAHPTFRRERHPDPVLVRFLDRYQDRIASEIAQTRRTAVARTFGILTAEHDFEAGDLIADYLEEGERAPIALAGAIIPAESRTLRGVPIPIIEDPGVAENTHGFVVLWHAERVRLVGGEATWRGIDAVEIDYFPRFQSITALSSPVGLPGDPTALLEAAAADFMAQRSTAEDQVPKVDLKVRLDQELNAYLDTVTGRRRAIVSQIRDSY